MNCLAELAHGLSPGSAVTAFGFGFGFGFAFALGLDLASCFSTLLWSFINLIVTYAGFHLSTS